MGIKEAFLAKARENEAREAAIRKNPALANSPEVKRQRRFAGMVLALIGVALLVADALSWEMVGSVVVVFIAIPIVFIPLGVYMMIVGKNPFLRLKK